MGRYRRTVSFPHPHPAPTPSKAYHVRSASLPCGRSDPLVPQLRDEIAELRAWDRASPSPPARAGSARLCDGLARLRSVLDSLDDVLQSPQAQDSLSSRAPLVEALLEDFLRFVDAYGTFRASAVGLKEEASAAQVAIRRRDAPSLGPALKAQKRIAVDIARLASAVGSAPAEGPTPCGQDDDDDDLADVIRGVRGLTAAVSAALFEGIASSFGLGRRASGWAGLGLGRARRRGEGGIAELVEALEGVEGLRKKSSNNKNNKNENKNDNNNEVLRRLERVEECMGEMERGSERVFRGLVATRVSLLNILTHA